MSEQKAEIKTRTLKLPSIVPKKVLVTILYPDRQLMFWGKISKDGNSIDGKNLGRFIIPSGYRPKITFFKGKTFLTFYYDCNGNAIEVKDSGESQIVSPDPSFTRALVDRGIIAKLFRLGLDWTQIATGIGLGFFVFGIIVFFLLPLFGIPIIIGKGAIQITPTPPQTTPVTGGNFTFPP